MDPRIFQILDRKRQGASLSRGELETISHGAATGDWQDAELAAFLMAAMIQGLDAEETRHLTMAMLESGEQWNLARDFPELGDKHSTGGVGDKVSLILTPLMAACGWPIVMLTGRGLGHTGGTADKLEAIPGLDLGLDRDRCCLLLKETRQAIGIATGAIAPADRRLYALRDRTATVASISLITASILSKKLATGAAAIVFDVKTGNGAFMQHAEDSLALARSLVDISSALGRRAAAVVTDMSQPLGRWAGHTAEIRESLDCLEGRGPDDLMEVVYTQCEELSDLLGERLSRQRLTDAIHSGQARERFAAWAAAQGAEASWLQAPRCALAPHEVAIAAPRSGFLAEVDTRGLGEALAAAGGGRLSPDAVIDFEIALEMKHRLGDAVDAGEEVARLYLRRDDSALIERFRSCFGFADQGSAPPIVRERVRPGG